MSSEVRAVDHDGLRDRLTDYIARLHIPRVVPVNRVISIVAADMADALLPFILEETGPRCGPRERTRPR